MSSDLLFVLSCIRYMTIVLGTISWLTSCNLTTSIEFDGAENSHETAIISKIRPIEAKPNDVVNVEGENFSEAKNLSAQLVLSDGSVKNITLTITDRNRASFVMPAGVGIGQVIDLFTGSNDEGGVPSVSEQHRR